MLIHLAGAETQIVLPKIVASRLECDVTKRVGSGQAAVAGSASENQIC